MLSHRYKNVLLASLLVGTSVHVNAFAPNHFNIATPTKSTNNAVSFLESQSARRIPFRSVGRKINTQLQMAADDFKEMAYTESGWACISTLTKAADYYSATILEAPLLMDVLLNPNKHGAGDDAEAARRAVEKVLIQAGVDANKLRQDLETHMSKQAKVAGGGADQQKSMGMTMVKVLEASRDSMKLLGVSNLMYI